jgi:ABC-type thiamin/hydroxymethylpyrimidine transport system permease subunit
MWLKIIIVVLFLAIIASLSSGLVFLLKDMGSSSKRTLYALGVRITLAALLVFCIWYGYYSGILSNNAPWAGQY